VAAGGGHENIVRLLLEKGAGVESKTAQGGTALHRAAGRGRKAIVQILLEHLLNNGYRKIENRVYSFYLVYAGF
jgi:ankyrin repeat protein